MDGIATGRGGSSEALTGLCRRRVVCVVVRRSSGAKRSDVAVLDAMFTCCVIGACLWLQIVGRLQV